MAYAQEEPTAHISTPSHDDRNWLCWLRYNPSVQTIKIAKTAFKAKELAAIQFASEPGLIECAGR